MGKHKEAFDFAFAAQSLAPSDSEVLEKVENIKSHIAAGLFSSIIVREDVVYIFAAHNVETHTVISLECGQVL